MHDAKLVEDRSSYRSFAAAGALALLVALTAAACAKRAPPTQPTVPPAGSLRVTATAYCKGTLTATGTKPTPGIVAADPAVLPFGTRIRLTDLDARYNGVYTVRDTGSSIRGHRIDLFVRDCNEAVRFGRHTATIAILK
jgi:3D (Asp-Asp-Asp) domain-containing protein